MPPSPPGPPLLRRCPPDATRTDRINTVLKLAVLIALLVLFGLLLRLGMALGYGFFTRWISTFKAFQQESEVRSSCTALWTGRRSRSRAAACWLGTSRTCASTPTQSASRSCARAPMIVRSIPPFDKSWIALIKSPYMLFKGWQRLLHDLIGREGPSLEIVCVPIAGLAILFWPLVVVGSVLLAIVLSIFVGLYGTIIVSRRNHFKGEFHMLWPMLQNSMYTNDWLYIREGIILPKPFYRKGKPSNFRVLSQNKCLCQSEAPALLVLDSAPARSVREAIQEVKMVHDPLLIGCDVRNDFRNDENIEQQRSNSSEPRSSWSSRKKNFMTGKMRMLRGVGWLPVWKLACCYFVEPLFGHC